MPSGSRKEASFAEFLDVVRGAAPDSFDGIFERGHADEVLRGGEDGDLVFVLGIELSVEFGDRLIDMIADEMGVSGRVGEAEVGESGRAGQEELKHLFLIGRFEEFAELGLDVIGSDDEGAGDFDIAAHDANEFAGRGFGDEVIGESGFAEGEEGIMNGSADFDPFPNFSKSSW